MDKKSVFTRILAITGTVLVWLPLLAPLGFGLARLIQSGRFLFDYLMPAELFPIVLLGGLLLFWAAWRAQAQKRLIGWGLLAMVLLLVGSQVIAILTGLASGETEPGGWQMVLVLALLGVYCLAILAVGLGGVRLLRTLYRKS